MNYSKLNNAPSNAVNNNSGPRFQNKNLNSFRNQQNFPSRPGPQKSGVQVIQAKQKVGKAVGAAAVPAAPTPMNTPSLKREIQSNQGGTVWGGQGSQSNDETSPSLKGMTAPAKPAPWAKSGNTEVEKVEEQKLESSASKQVRSWANADDSEEDERQDNSQDNEWPDNFREPVDEPLPPPRYPVDSHEDDYHQRYVPPYGRNKNNSRPADSSRYERNEPDGYFDSKNGNQPFQGFNRVSQNRPHMDRDGRQDTRNFRGRFENSSRRDDDFNDARRYPKDIDRTDRFQHFKNDDRRNDYGNYERSTDRRNDYESRYSRNEPNYRRGFNPAPPRPPAHNDVGEYRERSRTLSGDFANERGNQVSSRFPRSGREDQEKSNPDVGADIDDIEVSRREAEYLEAAKPRYPSHDARIGSYRNSSEPPQHNGAHDASDHKRSGYDRSDTSHDAPQQYAGRSMNPEARWEKANVPAGRDSMFGMYRGQDAVKLSFPVSQSLADDQIRNVDNGVNNYGSRPISMNIQSAQRHTRADSQLDSKPYASLFPNEVHGVDDAQEISEVSLNRGESTARPKKLYDPKSDQMEEYKGQKPQGAVNNRREQEKPKDNSDRWTRVSNLEKEKIPESELPPKEVVDEKLLSVKDPLIKSEITKKEEGSGKFSQQDERRIMRQKERQSRPPRTKGFLYCYNEKGELERVYSSWEKQQEELEQKKSGKSDVEEKITIKKRTDAEQAKKQDEPRESGSSWVNQQSFAGSKDQIDGKSENPGFLGNEPKVLMSSIEHPSSNLLGQLVPSIFESWNSAADTRVAELSGQSRMPWLTNSTGSANLGSTNPPGFAPGLSGLGTNFPGIISSNSSNSLFSSQRQDWGYGNILHTEPANTSLNTTFSSLNELNRPSTFATLGIISGLEEPIMHGEKKELPKDEANEAKYFQREWQRLGLGIGSKQNRGSKNSAPDTVAKESHIEAVVTPPVGLVIEAPKDLKSPVVAPPQDKLEPGSSHSDSVAPKQNRSDNRNHEAGRGSGPRDSRGRGRGRENRSVEARVVTTTSDSEKKPQRGRTDANNPSPMFAGHPGKEDGKLNHQVERIEKPRNPPQVPARKERPPNPKAAPVPERSEGKAHTVERVEPANNRNNAANPNTNNHTRPANSGGNNRNQSGNPSSRGAGGGRGFSGPRAHSEVLPNKGHHDK